MCLYNQGVCKSLCEKENMRSSHIMQKSMVKVKVEIEGKSWVSHIYFYSMPMMLTTTTLKAPVMTVLLKRVKPIDFVSKSR